MELDVRGGMEKAWEREVRVVVEWELGELGERWPLAVGRAEAWPLGFCLSAAWAEVTMNCSFSAIYNTISSVDVQFQLPQAQVEHGFREESLTINRITA